MGAGRPMGSTNKRDTAGVRLSLVAQQHEPEAFQTLLDVMKNGKSDGARVAAACAILDRGSGRPATQVDTVERDEHDVVYRSVEEIQRELLDTLRRLPKRLIVPLLKEIIGSNSPEDRDDELHVDGGVDGGGEVDGEVDGGGDGSGGVDGGG